MNGLTIVCLLLAYCCLLFALVTIWDEREKKRKREQFTPVCHSRFLSMTETTVSVDN